MQFMHRKKFNFIVISQEVISVFFLFLHNRQKPGIVAYPRKNAHTHTRVHAPTHARTYTCIHIYNACLHVYSQSHTHAPKHMRTRVQHTRAKHLHTCAHVSTLAQMHAYTYKHTHAWMRTHAHAHTTPVIKSVKLSYL